MERSAEVDELQRRMLHQGLQIGFLVVIVLLLALGVMCWQHEGGAIAGIAVGLCWSLGSIGLMLYRLGTLNGR